MRARSVLLLVALLAGCDLFGEDALEPGQADARYEYTNAADPDQDEALDVIGSVHYSVLYRADGTVTSSGGLLSLPQGTFFFGGEGGALAETGTVVLGTDPGEVSFRRDGPGSGLLIPFDSQMQIEAFGQEARGSFDVQALFAGGDRSLSLVGRFRAVVQRDTLAD